MTLNTTLCRFVANAGESSTRQQRKKRRKNKEMLLINIKRGKALTYSPGTAHWQEAGEFAGLKEQQKCFICLQMKDKNICLSNRGKGKLAKKWLRAAVFAFNLLDENMINLPVTNKLYSWNIGYVRKCLDAWPQGFWAARHLWICGGRKKKPG